jgi:hypothetical protein
MTASPTSDLRPPISDQPFRIDIGLPFKTTDAILAQCLRSAGLKETALSPRNVYDADIVFRAGGGVKDKAGNVTRASRFAGMDIFDAAKQLHKAGIRGRVEYHFEHPGKLLTIFLDAYSDQVRKIEESDGDAAEAILDIMRRAAGRTSPEEEKAGVSVAIMDEREAVLRILCIALKLRIEFVNRFKEEASAVVFLANAGEKQTGPGARPGSTVVRYPGGKFVPLYASKELLAKMNL